MVQMSDAALGGALIFAPLPPIVTPEEVLADALPVLDPPSSLSVTDAAERYVRVQAQSVWQNFDRNVTPYMVEPTDTTMSRLFRTVAFVGPSQSGKTMMLQTVALHAVTCDPDPTMIVHMSRPDRDKWVEEKLNPLIYNSPAVLERMGTAREDDTFGRKRFRGMRLLIGYPTATTLSGGTYKRVLLTDYDHHPAVLGRKGKPEGTPYRMALQRVKSFMSRGMILVESSPAWPVLDASWRQPPDAPHQFAPVGGGIVPIYNEGTRGRWYWECPDCGDEFEPRFDRLHYDAALEPGAAGDVAEMECPHCGVLIAHRHKVELNRRALSGHGGWRHEAADGTLVALDDEALRKTDIASFALNGAAATFATWRDLVANYESARRKAEMMDDDTDLGTVHYTEIGVPHRPLRVADENEITLDRLRDEAHDTPKGVAPAWTRFITVSVDVQGTYFAVQVTAWGEGGRAQVVDRVDITQPPEDAPHSERDAEGNCRTLAPNRFLEDWATLDGTLSRVWPVENAQYGLMPAAATVDFQGQAGVSDNAEAFWRARKSDGEGRRWFVSRGHGGWHHASRIWHVAPERKSGGGKGRTIKILNFASDRFKDTLAGMLARGGSASGGMIVPRWMDDARLGEFIAEQRESKGWDKKPGEVRNEGIDLSVMARVLAEQLGLFKVNFDRPPGWASGGPENTYAVPLDKVVEGEAPKDIATPAERRVPRKLF